MKCLGKNGLSRRDAGFYMARCSASRSSPKRARRGPTTLVGGRWRGPLPGRQQSIAAVWRADLPAVVREGLVRLRHLVRILALLHRVAAVVRRVHQLGGELLIHGLLAALFGVLDQPAHGERHPALLPHFHRDLVGGAADAAALLAAGDADGVERAANDVVAHAGQVLDAASADHHHRVLLEVVADAGDVAGDFHAVGQADAGDLAERGVRLLGRRGVDAGAHAPLLRAAGHRGRLALVDDLLAPLADELANRRHQYLSTRPPPRDAGGGRKTASFPEKRRASY